MADRTIGLLYDFTVAQLHDWLSASLDEFPIVRPADLTTTTIRQMEPGELHGWQA